MTLLAALPVSLMFVDLLSSLLMLAIGIGVGWWLNSAGGESASAPAPAESPGLNPDRAAEILARIGDLATSVATGVDEHSSVVAKCSTELAAAQASTAPDRDQQVLHSLSEILQANERLNEKLATAEMQIQRQAAELETQTAVARTDALTSLFNRRALDDELNRRMAEWHRRQSVFCLVMIDVDHFKKFNDVHGHQAGDEVLRGVASVLTETMREMDMVARFGGEEFALVLPMTNLVEGRRAAERARAAIEGSVFPFEGDDLRVTASLGVAEVSDVDQVGTLVKRADAALYGAKKAGRNRVWHHDGDDCFASVDSVAAKEPQAAAGASPSQAEPRDVMVEVSAALFNQELRRRTLECEQAQIPLSLLYADVDELPKLVADWGASATDAVFKQLLDAAEPLRGESGYVARVQSRLALVLNGVDATSAADRAERLREVVLASGPRLRGKQLNFTISVGVAQGLPNDGMNGLCQRADAAALASKASGKNCTHLHNGATCKLISTAAAAV